MQITGNDGVPPVSLPSTAGLTTHDCASSSASGHYISSQGRRKVHAISTALRSCTRLAKGHESLEEGKCDSVAWLAVGWRLPTRRRIWKTEHRKSFSENEDCAYRDVGHDGVMLSDRMASAVDGLLFSSLLCVAASDEASG